MTTLIHPGEKLVFSTRWLDDDDRSDCPSPTCSLQVVISKESADERHEALAQRQSLFAFLKSEVRSHAGATL